VPRRKKIKNGRYEVSSGGRDLKSWVELSVKVLPRQRRMMEGMSLRYIVSTFVNVTNVIPAQQ
jgi:hypothetical protein